MDWKGALRARLVADSAVSDLVWKDGSRPAIYWVERPQTDGLPALTLQTVTGDRPQHMGGFIGMDQATVQIDTWADTYAAADALMEAAIAALIPEQSGNGIKFSRAFLSGEPQDLGEQTATKFVHRKQVDLVFHHSTTA